uniref:Uncharacterized protein n=1 Tax=Knipowitschia caucasica TaxID=637954 RepID=A0AAV2JJG7_KNICA
MSRRNSLSDLDRSPGAKDCDLHKSLFKRLESPCVHCRVPVFTAESLCSLQSPCVHCRVPVFTAESLCSLPPVAFCPDDVQHVGFYLL